MMHGCGPDETFEERVTRLRHQYEIAPTAIQNVTASDWAPAVAVDLLVVPQGPDALEFLTLVLEIHDPDGELRATRRFTIETGGLVRGVTAQVSARVPDLEVREGEHATVELESVPPVDRWDEYPEYRNGIS